MIARARFVTSLDGLRAFEGQGLPEIAIAGRSNVGKSSLINKLCGQRGLARSGGRPGVTRLVNVYAGALSRSDGADAGFFLMDLPGYGFALAAKSEQHLWSQRIGGYLEQSPHLSALLHVVDIRHKPTVLDIQMMAWIRARGLPFRVVATKADKISGAMRQRCIFEVGRTLGIQPWEIIAFSAENGLGTGEVEAWIGAILSA